MIVGWILLTWIAGTSLAWMAGQTAIGAIIWPVYVACRIIALIWTLWCYLIQAPQPFQ